MKPQGLASATLQPNYSTWSGQINTYPKPYPSVSGYKHTLVPLIGHCSYLSDCFGGYLKTGIYLNKHLMELLLIVY